MWYLRTTLLPLQKLTEGSTGGLLSSEITNSRVPTTWSGWEGNMFCSVMRVAEQPGGVLELGMCGHLLHGNRDLREFSKSFKLARNDQRTIGDVPRFHNR